MSRQKKLGLLSIGVLLLLCSCSTMVRTSGAVLGGGTTALINPLAIPVGIAGGIAAADLYLQEETIEEQQEQIKSLTMGDVENYTQSFGDKILDQIYGILKFIGVVCGLVFLIQFLYTRKRKKFAEKYYKIIEEKFNEK